MLNQNLVFKLMVSLFILEIMSIIIVISTSEELVINFIARYIILSVVILALLIGTIYEIKKLKEMI